VIWIPTSKTYFDRPLVNTPTGVWINNPTTEVASLVIEERIDPFLAPLCASQLRTFRYQGPTVLRTLLPSPERIAKRIRGTLR
jgi:hypothetical protein